MPKEKVRTRCLMSEGKSVFRDGKGVLLARLPAAVRENDDEDRTRESGGNRA